MERCQRQADGRELVTEGNALVDVVVVGVMARSTDRSTTANIPRNVLEICIVNIGGKLDVPPAFYRCCSEASGE